MGKLSAKDLPRLLQDAQTVRAASAEDARPIGLGQLLVRRKLLTVSEYLRVAREAGRAASQEDSSASLARLGRALEAFASGTLDATGLEEAISSGGMD